MNVWASDFPAESVVRKKRTRSVKVIKSGSGKYTNSESIIPVDELVVHTKKIQEVKNWLEKCKNRDILLLSGPPGAAKTTTLRAIAFQLKINVIEWITPVDKGDFPFDDKFLLDDDVNERVDYTYTKQLDKFHDFVRCSSRYKPLFGKNTCQRLLLIEDFPNYFLWKPNIFHEFLDKFKSYAQSPIVFICTDDEKLNLTNHLFPNNIMSKHRIDNIKFNPVPCTAMNRLLKKHIGDTVEKTTIDKLVVSSNGDIRTALSSLQFLILEDEFREPKTKCRKQKSFMDEPKISNILPTKDINIDFFRVIGRVLYPKRNPVPNESGRIFTHDVFQIADHLKYSSISVLHENYMETFKSLNDITKACDVLSLCNVFDRNDVDLSEYSSLIAVLGVMCAKTEVKTGVFKPMYKSKWNTVVKDKNKTKTMVQINHSTRMVDSQFVLDVQPYLKFFGDSTKTWNGKKLNLRLAPPDPEEENELRIEEFED